MTNDESKKQNDEQIKPEATDNSLSDADLEQVAGGRWVYYFNPNNLGSIGTRHG